MGETSSTVISILLSGVATKFWATLLTQISKLNYYNQSIHLINRGLDSIFFNKTLELYGQ